MLSAFPLAVALFAASVDANVIDHWYSEPWRFGIATIAIVTSFSIATVIVFDDFRIRPMAPYVLKARLASEAARIEKDLRIAAKKKTSDKKLEQLRSTYRNLIHIKTLEEFQRRAGPIAYIHLSLAALGTFFAVFYVWYLVAAAEYKVHHHASLGKANENRLILILILLATWFPMRLHTEWYQNYFHKRNWLSGYPAFWLLAALAFTALIFMGIMIRPDGLLQFIPILNVVFVAALGIVGKLKPEWLGAVADFLESTPFIYFIGLYFIFCAIIAVTTAITILNAAS